MRTILYCNLIYPSFFADVIIAFLGAVFGLGGAFWIYIASIRRLRNDRLKYVVTLIESVIASTTRQANFCTEHSKVILENSFNHTELKLEANRDTKRLADKLDQEGVYHAYLWKYKRNNMTYENFKNLYAYIDYLDYQLDDMISTNLRIIESNWKRKKQYQMTFDKAKEIIQSFSLNKDFIEERKEFVLFATKTLKIFLEKENEQENIFESFETMVLPIRKFIGEEVKEHPKVTELYFLLNNLSGDFYAIELQSKHNAKDYEYYAAALKRSADHLEESSRKLRADFRIGA